MAPVPARRRLIAWADRLFAMLLRAAVLAMIIAFGVTVLRQTTQMLTELAHGSAHAPALLHPVK